MDIPMSMGSTEQARVQSQVSSFNEAIQGSSDSGTQLGRDDFLKILITQLQNQDPTKPMEDKEFISQMAQFSSLEQMTNMSQGFQQMNSLLSSSQALSVLGRTVEVQTGNQTVRGTVSSVTNGAMPQITIDEQQYDYSNIQRVIQ
ncbi:MAG: flagellar hook assembly protein FlgD [Alkalispirochaeta sp.]